MSFSLLIVPYGIETRSLVLDSVLQLSLLIVPYGIETDIARFIDFDFNLLIVPYGIETLNDRHFGFRFISFNRTLWN